MLAPQPWLQRVHRQIAVGQAGVVALPAAGAGAPVDLLMVRLMVRPASMPAEPGHAALVVVLHESIAQGQAIGTAAGGTTAAAAAAWAQATLWKLRKLTLFRRAGWRGCGRTRL